MLDVSSDFFQTPAHIKNYVAVDIKNLLIAQGYKITDDPAALDHYRNRAPREPGEVRGVSADGGPVAMHLRKGHHYISFVSSRWIGVPERPPEYFAIGYQKKAADAWVVPLPEFEIQLKAKKPALDIFEDAQIVENIPQRRNLLFQTHLILSYV